MQYGKTGGSGREPADLAVQDPEAEQGHEKIEGDDHASKPFPAGGSGHEPLSPVALRRLLVKILDASAQ